MSKAKTIFTLGGDKLVIQCKTNDKREIFAKIFQQK